MSSQDNLVVSSFLFGQPPTACDVERNRRKKHHVFKLLNKLLMEENDGLQKQVSHLVYENGHFRQQTHNPGPGSIGIVDISNGCTGVGARACGLVDLEPTRVAEILKDRTSWFCNCRSIDVLNVFPTGNGGIIELLYMHVCERSLSGTQGGHIMPQVQNFVRSEMLPNGYIIRSCEGDGSTIHIVHHMNLEAWTVPEVMRSLYESSLVLSQKTTMVALHQLKRIFQEVSQTTITSWGIRHATLQVISQRLSRTCLLLYYSDSCESIVLNGQIGP